MFFEFNFGFFVFLFALQSERFYAALKGHGVQCRLVLLPHEGHGYRARESILHKLREISDWLEVYCKNRASEETVEKENSGKDEANEKLAAALSNGKPVSAL